MKFGYTFIFVPDVEATVAFYEKAFGLKLRFLVESKLYAEMETGDTALGFVAEHMGEEFNIAKNTATKAPAGIEIAFVTDNVQSGYECAIKAGCMNVKAPEVKHWGQIVACVRDLNGVLIEISSPITVP